MIRTRNTTHSFCMAFFCLLVLPRQYPVSVPFRPVQVGVFATCSFIFSTYPPACTEICVSISSITTSYHNTGASFACFLTSLHHFAPVLRQLPLSPPYLGYKKRVNFQCDKGKVNQKYRTRTVLPWCPGHQSLLSKLAPYVYL